MLAHHDGEVASLKIYGKVGSGMGWLPHVAGYSDMQNDL
jgi:hypothetical protein